MEKIGRPGGLFAIFKFIQYIPYIVIGLLIVVIVFWVIFGIKKFRWAKTLAVISTVLVVVTSLLFFSPYLIGAIMGKQVPIRGFFEIKDPAAGKEQFRDYRDRQNDKREDKQKYEEEKKESGLDIETRFHFVKVNGKIIHYL